MRIVTGGSLLLMAHGTRSCYQTGCRELTCRAAEASYRASLRRRRAKGLPVLGSYISASEAWARIRVLKQEGFEKQQISGWRNRLELLPAFTPQTRVRLQTLIRLRTLCHQYLIADSELPNHAAPPS